MHSNYKLEKVFSGFDFMLIASEDIPKGAELPKLQGQLCLFRTKHSVETEKGHVEDKLYSFMNHSFSPTVHVHKDGSVSTLVALKAGQELTSNYKQHESEIAFPFEDLETGKIVK